MRQNFPGVRGGHGLLGRVTTSTQVESERLVDRNLDERADVRIDWTNALPVSTSSRLEPKPSFRFLAQRAGPDLRGALRHDGDPDRPLVRFPLQELDTFFTVALVVGPWAGRARLALAAHRRTVQVESRPASHPPEGCRCRRAKDPGSLVARG